MSKLKELVIKDISFTIAFSYIRDTKQFDILGIFTCGIDVLPICSDDFLEEVRQELESKSSVITLS